jgi:acetyltransferase
VFTTVTSRICDPINGHHIPWNELSHAAIAAYPLASTLFTGKDGRVARVRPIRSADEPELIAAFGRLSPETVYRRFLSPIRNLPPATARRLARVDQIRRFALVAEVEVDGEWQIVAVGRYEPAEQSGIAEIALVVGDCWQNNGLGRYLLRRLLSAAAANRITRFRGDALADNRPVLHLLETETEIRERRTEAGVVRLYFERR